MNIASNWYLFLGFLPLFVGVIAGFLQVVFELQLLLLRRHKKSLEPEIFAELVRKPKRCRNIAGILAALGIVSGPIIVGITYAFVAFSS